MKNKTNKVVKKTRKELRKEKIRRFTEETIEKYGETLKKLAYE